MKLEIVGRCNTNIRYKFNHILYENSISENQEILFCDFSEYDIPIGFCFSSILNDNNQQVYKGKIILCKVSQEFALNFDLIPKGYKTICTFEFTDVKTPSIINKLPKLNDWYGSNCYLYFTV